jgi:hypothetical protein
MVYFMCDHCGATVKKNQTKRHSAECGSNKFACVDCNTVFVGRDVDAHVSCKSEAEKYYGKYFQGNEGKKEEKGEEKKEIQNIKGNAEKERAKWTGWKNEIKKVLKGETDGVEVKELEKRMLKRYKECFPSDSKAKGIFLQKVQFKRFIKSGDKVHYYRYLKES